MSADEEGTLATPKAIRRELIDSKIAEHRRRIVKTTGDGMLVEFASVVGTVRCAVEIQRCMANCCTMHHARPLDDKTHCRELRPTTSLDLPLPASA